MFCSLRSAILFASVSAAAVSAFAETWYWSPTVKSGSNYPWQNAANWLNSANQRNVGYPAAGDTAVLGDTASSSGTGTHTPDSNRALYEIRIGPGKVVTMSQGDYTLAAGGRGFQLLYNQNAANWNVPEVRVQQGAIDCSMDSGTISNCRFMFDGNDSSQRFTMGYSNHKGLNLNNCGLYETNGVANTDHGFDDRGKGYQVSFTGTQKLNPTVFTGKFYQKAGLKWNPSSADSVFIYLNGVSAAAGVVTVAKGTVKLVNGASFTNLAELQVSAGAVFEIVDAPSESFYAALLTLGGATAKIKVPADVNSPASPEPASSRSFRTAPRLSSGREPKGTSRSAAS